MVRPTVTIEVKYNNFSKIAASLPAKAALVVKKAAFDIEAEAKARVPVRSGNLKNSIKAEPESATVWVVAPHTDYALYVELGTSRMGARPYMGPAAEMVRPSFVAACDQMLASLK